MKKVIRLTESDLTRIITRIINESDRMYGHDEISKLYSTLGDDEDVELSDESGELSGQVVKKIQYVKNMLEKSIENEDWDMVRRAMNYLDMRL